MSISAEAHSAQVAGAQVSVSPRRFPGADLASWRAKRVRLYIEAHLEHRLDTEVLARVACISRAHFCRGFKRKFGLTVHQYIVRRRIERAQHLMLTTTAPLTEIASACGMSDQSHLTRLFRKAAEQSPAAWRKQNLEWRMDA